MEFIRSEYHLSQRSSAGTNSPASASFSRPRASSLPASFAHTASKKEYHPIIDPFAGWDDSTLFSGKYTVMPVGDDSILKLDVEKLRVAIRRSKMTDRSAASEKLVEQISDQDSSTRCSSPWQQTDTSSPFHPAIDRSRVDWRDPHFVARSWTSEGQAPEVSTDHNSVSRLPSRSRAGESVTDRSSYHLKYLEELDELGRKIFERSLFQKYIVSKTSIVKHTLSQKSHHNHRTGQSIGLSIAGSPSMLSSPKMRQSNSLSGRKY